MTAFAVLALAVGSLAFMGSTAKISQKPRVWLAKRAKGTGVNQWLFDLVSCPYCLGTWISFAATAVYRPLLVHLWWPADYVATSLAMAAAVMLPMLVIKRAVS